MKKAAIKREQSDACISYAERSRLERSSMKKAAIKREQSDACINYAERKQARTKFNEEAERKQARTKFNEKMKL